jgi:hypothetical protein
MAEDKQIREVATHTPGQGGQPLAEHGILTDVVVPIAAATAGGAAAGAAQAYVSNVIQNRPTEPPPAPPPAIELPPGVDPD